MGKWLNCWMSCPFLWWFAVQCGGNDTGWNCCVALVIIISCCREQHLCREEAIYSFSMSCLDTRTDTFRGHKNHHYKKEQQQQSHIHKSITNGGEKTDAGIVNWERFAFFRTDPCGIRNYSIKQPQQTFNSIHTKSAQHPGKKRARACYSPRCNPQETENAMEVNTDAGRGKDFTIVAAMATFDGIRFASLYAVSPPSSTYPSVP